MSESEKKLLTDIKEFMKLRQKAYEATHQFSKTHVVKLLIRDLTEKYEYMWRCGYD